MRDVFRSVCRGVAVFAKWLGHVQSMLVLSILYYIVVGLIAAIVRAWSDPLGLQRRRGPALYNASYWRGRQVEPRGAGRITQP